MDSEALDAIERLASLFERGLLTIEEYEAEKQRLLGRVQIVEDPEPEIDESLCPEFVPFFPLRTSETDRSLLVNRPIAFVVPKLLRACMLSGFEGVRAAFEYAGETPAIVIEGSTSFTANWIKLRALAVFLDDFATEIQVEAWGGDRWGRSVAKRLGMIKENLDAAMQRAESQDALNAKVGLRNPRWDLPQAAEPIHYYTVSRVTWPARNPKEVNPGYDIARSREGLARGVPNAQRITPEEAMCLQAVINGLGGELELVPFGAGAE
jgi:hypothetical protein